MREELVQWISVNGNFYSAGLPLVFIARCGQCIVAEFLGSGNREASSQARADVMQIYVGDDILSL